MVILPHVRRFRRFQNLCDDDIHGHETQIWSYDQTPRQPLYGHLFASYLSKGYHSPTEKIKEDILEADKAST